MVSGGSNVRAGPPNDCLSLQPGPTHAQLLQGWQFPLRAHQGHAGVGAVVRGCGFQA